MDRAARAGRRKPHRESGDQLLTGISGGRGRPQDAPAVSLGLVTPVYARVGRELIEGRKNRSVVTDPTALAVFPIRPVGLREAISRPALFMAPLYRVRLLAQRRHSVRSIASSDTSSPK